MWIKCLFVFWQATGQVGKRVRFATRALSDSVSAAIRCYLPRWEVRAQAIGVIDRWFNTLNSRVPHADKLERSGYGIQGRAGRGSRRYGYARPQRTQGDGQAAPGTHDAAAVPAGHPAKLGVAPRPVRGTAASRRSQRSAT